MFQTSFACSTLATSVRRRRVLNVSGKKMMLSLGLKTRKKFHFDVTFTLQELLNCTYVTGQLFAKVRLKDGAFNAHSLR